ncbi:MAG: hypothetical protein ABI668_15820 [Sphingorhabdus sp.]
MLKMLIGRLIGSTSTASPFVACGMKLIEGLPLLRRDKVRAAVLAAEISSVLGSCSSSKFIANDAIVVLL